MKAPHIIVTLEVSYSIVKPPYFSWPIIPMAFSQNPILLNINLPIAMPCSYGRA